MTRGLVVLLAVAAGVAIVYAIVSGLDRRAAPPIVIEDPLVAATVVVAVDGAVATPGTYALPADARLGDAVAAAGGYAPDADLSSINPARRVRDEDRIVIPRIPVAAEAGTGAGATPAPPAAEDGRLDLNAATAEQLDALPGIGPVLAQRIVEARRARGPFQSVDDLVEIDGISVRIVDELRPLVVAP